MTQYSPQSRETRLGWIEAWRKWAEEDNEHISTPGSESFGAILNDDMDDTSKRVHE